MWSSNTPTPERKKAHGLSGALSRDSPTARDLEQSETLQRTLENLNIVESENEFHHRMFVLSQLNELVKEWVYDLSIAKNVPAEEATIVGGQIFTFGSYRLGVHSKGADIDALCVAPRHIDRTDYFDSFLHKLKAHPEITDLRPVKEAFVPVIKLCFSGIEIDLLFARLAYRVIPEKLDLQNDSILRNLDIHCVRSLNGCRVTDEILNLVPNINNFRSALQAIRLWAKRSRIYSNVLGYLGGVSWAMLVARVCQLYPNAAPSTIIHKFFLVFTQWQWPRPVLLTPTYKPKDLDFPVWDPNVNASDKTHLMPIITPSYPQQNSTYNVTYSTRSVIIQSLHNGFRIAEEIVTGRAEWSLLFEKHNFFSNYKHFLLVVVSSATKEDHLEWYGLVESKLRQLVILLERNPRIALAHVNTETFKLKEDSALDAKEASPKSVDDSPNPEDGAQETGPDSADGAKETSPNSVWVVGLEFCKTASASSIDLTHEVQGFTNAVMKHAANFNQQKDTNEARVVYVKSKGLTKYLSEELIKRDRSTQEIMAPILENSAAILLKRKAEEAATNGKVAGAGPPHRTNSQFKKVNTPGKTTAKTPEVTCVPVKQMRLSATPPSAKTQEATCVPETSPKLTTTPTPPSAETSQASCVSETSPKLTTTPPSPHTPTPPSTLASPEPVETIDLSDEEAVNDEPIVIDDDDDVCPNPVKKRESPVPVSPNEIIDLSEDDLEVSSNAVVEILSVD